MQYILLMVLKIKPDRSVFLVQLGTRHGIVLSKIGKNDGSTIKLEVQSVKIKNFTYFQFFDHFGFKTMILPTNPLKLRAHLVILF